MNEEWFQPLQDLFDSLGQDPIEDAPSLMDIDGSVEEKTRWTRIIDDAILAAQNTNDSVIAIFSPACGYKVQTLNEALSILIELRELYLVEIET